MVLVRPTGHNNKITGCLNDKHYIHTFKKLLLKAYQLSCWHSGNECKLNFLGTTPAGSLLQFVNS